MTCSSCPNFSALDSPPTCRAKPAGVYMVAVGPNSFRPMRFPPVLPDEWCAEHPDRKRPPPRLVGNDVIAKEGT